MESFGFEFCGGLRFRTLRECSASCGACRLCESVLEHVSADTDMCQHIFKAYLKRCSQNNIRTCQARSRSPARTEAYVFRAARGQTCQSNFKNCRTENTSRSQFPTSRCYSLNMVELGQEKNTNK